ncbi:hypothetical protein GMDG_06366 [Pseudogymnoascus destructans 20631-21]|uniref:HAT C-terminal dimerisation domain-containing protein n=1 Tax=Pseudogymnoascus destructans (strain ATCC MYA-4855 / 20631-21) TaxID=658429 RepID=L8FTC2_PSED2|nr:hypothetical protein GMDG_06366 [Pseudogymnoascus destructans 20631-21]
MARDILCIPASEALVERVFSTARAVCNYRHNQMAPETIRGIMLVFYRQKIEREQLFEHYSVTDIIDSTYMNDEELSFEYNALIDNIQEKMALQYIPDRSPRQPNTYDRTRRNKDRQKDSRPENFLITAQEAMENLYETGVLDGLKFVTFGRHVNYSLSPMMHETAYAHLGMKGQYYRYTGSSLDELAALSQDPHFGGAGISQPFKVEIMSRCVALTRHAKAIGASKV